MYCVSDCCLCLLCECLFQWQLFVSPHPQPQLRGNVSGVGRRGDLWLCLVLCLLKQIVRIHTPFLFSVWLTLVNNTNHSASILMFLNRHLQHAIQHLQHVILHLKHVIQHLEHVILYLQHVIQHLHHVIQVQEGCNTSLSPSHRFVQMRSNVTDRCARKAGGQIKVPSSLPSGCLRTRFTFPFLCISFVRPGTWLSYPLLPPPVPLFLSFLPLPPVWYWVQQGATSNGWGMSIRQRTIFSLEQWGEIL